MNERSELNIELNAAVSRSFYCLKQELADFCRENGLPTSGSKAELCTGHTNSAKLMRRSKAA